MAESRNDKVRNVVVIAHVDHGKTTLVDAILRQTGVFRLHQTVEDRVMDSDQIEKERGITILAKNTSVNYEGVKINIVDTPGHADFGGEVERILSMVDGALLLVDACDGPMPQTRFVVQKALSHKLKIVLVINKIDRPEARLEDVYNEVFDLLVNLGADDDDVEFPVVYSDARTGFATKDLGEAKKYQKGERTGVLSIDSVLDAVLETVPAPFTKKDAPLQMLVSTLSYDDYVGRIAIGRVESSTLKKGQKIALCRLDGNTVPFQVSKLWVFQGLKRVEVDEVFCGDIAAVSGIEDVDIGETIADANRPAPLKPIRVEEPTVQVAFKVNDSPFAGRDGDYITSRHLRERLYREGKKDVSLKIEDTEDPDTFRVSGRGELHLSILMENMRREGYEMGISKPLVILKFDGGEKKEPYEFLTIDVPEEHMGKVMEELGPRKAEIVNVKPDLSKRVRLEFRIPTRGIMGFRPLFMTLTKGLGIMHHVFEKYGPYSGEIVTRHQGAMIAWEDGTTTAYALANAEERGTLFVGPGEEVYAGEIIGEHSRQRDLDINVCKKKHLTNMRAAAADISVKLTPPKVMGLEDALQWINEDELVEVTPEAVRIRKAVLGRLGRARSKKGLETDF